jgi:PIN like domain
VSRVCFTDRDFGEKFPALLAEAGLQVERHPDLLTPEVTDEDWLERCGRDGRIADSHSSGSRNVPNELQAVRRFNVPLLTLIGSPPTAELRNFVNALGRIEDFSATHTLPFIAKVYRLTITDSASAADAPGRIQLCYPTR